MRLHNILTLLISTVWLVNGLFCKILNLVPRHREIVARILGEEHSLVLTKTIGTLEILMAFWVFSRIKVRICTLFQVVLVATMNVIEFILTPDLLLFGRLNIFIATIFIAGLVLNDQLYHRSLSSPIFKH